MAFLFGTEAALAILTAIASQFILFAVMGGSLSALGPEPLIFALVAGVAAWGFRRDLRLVIAGPFLSRARRPDNQRAQKALR